MINTPKISVVIPSYNKVRYIRQTLKSIFDQGYPDLEVIIQDGGSTDGTVEIIKEFAKKYPVRWVSKRDNGQLDAVNKGLSKATGKILTFINADDCYNSHTFESVAKCFLSHPNKSWFAGRGIVINSGGNEIAKAVTSYKNLLLSLNSYQLLLSTNYLMQPSVFFTREAFKKFGPFTGTHDFITEYGFWLEIGKHSMPVTIKKVITKFRIEPTTKTKTMFKSLLKEDWKIVNKYTSNPLILLLHILNNFGRVIVGRFV